MEVASIGRATVHGPPGFPSGVSQPAASLEREFAQLTAAVSRLDAMRLAVLRELDVAQAATVDGARTMTEWVAGRFDLETTTARTLMSLARAADTTLETALGDGRITNDRYLHIQPSLDDSRWKLWGQLAGIDAHQATVSNGQTGASVAGGPRIGSRTLGEILCSGTISLNFEDTAAASPPRSAAGSSTGTATAASSPAAPPATDSKPARETTRSLTLARPPSPGQSAGRSRRRGDR